MKSNQSQRHGSAKLSPPNPQFKCGASSSKTSENISKYFSKNKPNEDSQFDSPYKKCLSEIKCEVTRSDDSKDFMTPKPIKIYKKSRATVSLSRNNKSKPKSNSRKCKPSTGTYSIFKTTQDNFGSLDVNPDHLQMALALSKSTYAAEYPEQSKEIEDFPAFLTPDKIPKGKTTLERYGFKSDKPKLCTELKREHFEVPKRNKNSKFRFITPTLKTRTVEERESIIATKISMILNSNKTFNVEDSQEVENVELYSEMLREFKGNCSLFAANGFGLEENKYYIENLNISPTKSKRGCLLKRWEDIPGRDKSPVRNQSKFEHAVKKCTDNTQTDTSPNIQTNNEEYKVTTHLTSFETISNPSERFSLSRECISPDLFESDSDNSSQSLLSPSRKERTVLSLQSDNSNKENVPTRIKFDEETVNLPKINDSVSTSGLLEDIPQNSQSEDTEQLYIKSLQSDDEFVTNLTQNSSVKKRNEFVTKKLWPDDEDGANFCLNTQRFEDECIILSSSSDCSNDCPPNTLSTKLKLDKNLCTVFEEEEDTEQFYLNSQKSEKEFVMNFTQKSPSKKYNESVTTKFSPKNEDCADSNLTSHKFEDECIILSSSSDCSNDYAADRNSKELDLDIEAEKRRFEDNDSRVKLKNSSNALENHNFENDKETSGTSKTSLRISFGLDDCNNSLNVTDYIHQILNENDSKIDQNKSNNSINNSSGDFDLKNVVQNENELSLSQESTSKESIVISDEELNYSSIHSKDTKCEKYFSDSSDVEENFENDTNEAEDVDMDEVYRISSALRNKYRTKTALTPVHNRVSELRAESSPKITSVTKACLDDSFNKLLESSSVFKELEIEQNKQEPPTENKCTPEKLVAPTSDAEKTPDNNLIIKTKDVTPLPNYDEMNTPGIINELHKFGLKPLKRRRGIKLLKYLYECTHPLVGPDGVEELSSDEDERKRVPKKRKKSKQTNDSAINPIVVKNNGFTSDQSDIEIVGDALLQNQNLDELIFERKYSVRISSCRVPLQIVWHNFLSKNPHIKETILFYEPLQLEVLHTMLKEQTGCKFHIQDLLTFFDRKCITIRTAQGSQKRGQKN